VELSKLGEKVHLSKSASMMKSKSEKIKFVILWPYSQQDKILHATSKPTMESFIFESDDELIAFSEMKGKWLCC